MPHIPERFMYKIKELILVTAVGLLCCFCNPKKSNGTAIQGDSMGVFNLKTEFYDRNGKSTFLGPMKIWYFDSVAIEELVTIKSVTDTLKNTTVSIIPEAYRYIDLKSNSWYLYKTFDDTARILKRGTLPDTVFVDGGWTFYVNNLPMKGKPEVLPDTMIGAIKYRRIKFSPVKRGPASYIIGYLRCDNNKGKLFSLEKDFSTSMNCTMTRYFEFREGALRPFASSELEFLSDTLSAKELKVFAAWEKNQRDYPVH